MLTNAFETVKYIRASAGRAGLNVVFEDVDQPRHDGKTIYLPKITKKTTEKELMKLMASIDHEVGHERLSDFKLLKEKERHPLLMFTWNFIEDSRVNHLEGIEYKGFRKYYDEVSSEMIEEILKKLHKETAFPAVLIRNLIEWETNLSKELFPLVHSSTTSFKQTETDKKFQEVLEKHSKELLQVQKIENRETGSKATLDLAEKILIDLGKDLKHEPLVITAIGDDKSASDPDTVELDKTEAGGKDETTLERDKIITLKIDEKELIKKALTAIHTGKDESKKSDFGINLEYTSKESSKLWTLSDPKDFIVVDYPRKTVGGKSRLDPKEFFEDYSVDDFLSTYEKKIGSKIIADENFASQIRRLIQIRAKVQTQYGVKKGKLDQSRLSRICLKNSGSFADKIFKRSIENNTLDAAVTILVDMSGSMHGDKLLNAVASAKLLASVCMSLSIPLEILGFTDDHINLPVMFVYKAFSDLKIAPNDILRYFALSSRFMTGNPDGENILWAYDRILKRKELRKILVVMSDGSPAASKGDSGLASFTKEVVENIENSKKVDIYGLGILSASVKDFYTNNSVLNNTHEIPIKLLELFEKKILG